jgi:HSP20 family protein
MKMSRLDVRNGAFEELSSDMERIFDSLLGRTVGTMLRTKNAEQYAPTLDITESPEAYEVHVDLPGVRPEDVKLEMHDGKLVISGTRSISSDQKEKAFHRMERVSGSFSRVISLPTEVDPEKIDASYEHGVLRIVIPKAVKQQPKKIAIRTSAN